MKCPHHFIASDQDHRYPAIRQMKFFAQSLELVMESERPVQLYPKIRWDWTGWQYVATVVNIKFMFGLSVVKMKAGRRRFRIAELQPPSLEIS